MLVYYLFFAIYTIVWNIQLLKKLLSNGSYTCFLSFQGVSISSPSPWFNQNHNLFHKILLTYKNEFNYEHIILKNKDHQKIHIKTFNLKYYINFYLSIIIITYM